MPGPTSANSGLVARVPAVELLVLSSTWMVSPLTLARPEVLVMLSAAGPDVVLLGTVKTIFLSVQEDVGRVVPLDLSTPVVDPNPKPVIVTTRLSPAVFLRTNGRSTASSCG